MVRKPLTYAEEGTWSSANMEYVVSWSVDYIHTRRNRRIKTTAGLRELSKGRIGECRK